MSTTSLVAKNARDVEPHDLLDLAGDHLTDPDATNDDFAEAYATVLRTSQVTPNYVVLTTTLGTFAFPPTHVLFTATL